MFEMNHKPYAHWSLAQTAPPGPVLEKILATLQEDTLTLTGGSSGSWGACGGSR